MRPPRSDRAGRSPGRSPGDGPRSARAGRPSRSAGAGLLRSEARASSRSKRSLRAGRSSRSNRAGRSARSYVRAWAGRPAAHGKRSLPEARPSPNPPRSRGGADVARPAVTEPVVAGLAVAIAGLGRGPGADVRKSRRPAGHSGQPVLRPHEFGDLPADGDPGRRRPGELGDHGRVRVHRDGRVRRDCRPCASSWRRRAPGPWSARSRPRRPLRPGRCARNGARRPCARSAGRRGRPGRCRRCGCRGGDCRWRTMTGRARRRTRRGSSTARPGAGCRAVPAAGMPASVSWRASRSAPCLVPGEHERPVLAAGQRGDDREPGSRRRR